MKFLALIAYIGGGSWIMFCACWLLSTLPMEARIICVAIALIMTWMLWVSFKPTSEKHS